MISSADRAAEMTAGRQYDTRYTRSPNAPETHCCHGCDNEIAHDGGWCDNCEDHMAAYRDVPRAYAVFDGVALTQAQSAEFGKVGGGL